ncbi:MAG TPA: hypothetical protein VJN90_07035 [Candidatus Acidoferrales bacterium]|nr:hypothetical protein [Candidatus Acidoferrales bacterium]
MRFAFVSVLLLLAFAFVTKAQVNNGYETIRIPTASTPRCINSKTDEITLSVYRVTVEKTSGFFTRGNQAGIAVVSTLNADGAAMSAKTPSVNIVPISEEHGGQVFLPLEYPIASQLLLSEGTGANAVQTKNMLLEMYLEKTRGSNSFGTFLTTAGTLLGKLSIPANPYLTAANQFINFANQSIQNETANSGAKLFATVTFQFADRNYSDVQSCENAGDQETGAVAVIAGTGSHGPNLLRLGNLAQKFCWRYNVSSTYEIQYALKPADGCSVNISDAQWAEPSNDYVMLFLSAAVANPPASLLIRQNAGYQYELATPEGNAADFARVSQRLKDLTNSRVLCDDLKVPRKLCGVN